MPIGIVFAARAIRYMLNVRAARKPPHHKYCSVPVAVLVLPRQNVKATSINPANMRITQFKTVILIYGFTEREQSQTHEFEVLHTERYSYNGDAKK